MKLTRPETGALTLGGRKQSRDGVKNRSTNPRGEKTMNRALGKRTTDANLEQSIAAMKILKQGREQGTLWGALWWWWSWSGSMDVVLDLRIQQIVDVVLFLDGCEQISSKEVRSSQIANQ